MIFHFVLKKLCTFVRKGLFSQSFNNLKAAREYLFLNACLRSDKINVKAGPSLGAAARTVKTGTEACERHEN